MTKHQRQGLVLFITGWGTMFATHGDWWTLLPILVGWFMFVSNDAVMILTRVLLAPVAFWLWLQDRFNPSDDHQNAVRVARQATEPHDG